MLDSRAPHTLKDLEKTPPSTNPKIRGAEIKELLAALLAENQVRCEKIGSGNWYWAFASDTNKAREKALGTAKAECARLEESVVLLEKQIEKRKAELHDKKGDGNKACDRPWLEEQRTVLVEENEGLQAKVRAYSAAGSVADVLAKKKDVPNMMAKVERWEDNMAILESYVVKLSGGDRSVLQDVRHAVYGQPDDTEADEQPAKRARIMDSD